MLRIDYNTADFQKGAEAQRWCRQIEPQKEARGMFDRVPRGRRPSLREWFEELSPQQQVGYGCIGVIIAGTLMLYCAGTVSMLARPFLLQRDPTPTPILLTTLPPIQSPPTFIQLPQGTVPATPTQAPIPTREPATPTPTPDPFVTPATVTATPSTGTPRASASSTAKFTPTPTRRTTGTPTR